MRIAVGSLMQETNSFSPTHTTVETFAAYYLLRGDEILTGYGDARVEVPAFLDVLRSAGATPVPLLATWAASGGPLTRDAFATLLDELVARLRDALPVDGVLLALHGAMVVVDDSDAEGAILAAVRSVVGPAMPLVISLDLHAHITPRMVQEASAILGYHEYPHIDMYETGARAATLLIEMIHRRVRPVMALAKRPMVVSAVAARTTEGPLKEVVALPGRWKRRVASWRPACIRCSRGLTCLIWASRLWSSPTETTRWHERPRKSWLTWSGRGGQRFEPELVDLDAAIRSALEAAEGLTVISDAGNAPTSGAPGDSAVVLRALLAAGADRAARLTYLTLCDASAAQSAAAAGVGAVVTLRVGHAVSTGTPVEVTGRVQTLSDGVFRMSGAGATGLEMHMGLTAVLAIGSVRLAIRSLPAMEWDPALFFAIGLDPREAGLVFVKSPAHFRVSFAPLAQRVLVADTPGAACVNMRRMPFTHVTRPLYPLDDL